MIEKEAKTLMAALEAARDIEVEPLPLPDFDAIDVARSILSEAIIEDVLYDAIYQPPEVKVFQKRNSVRDVSATEINLPPRPTITKVGVGHLKVEAPISYSKSIRKLLQGD